MVEHAGALIGALDALDGVSQAGEWREGTSRHSPCVLKGSDDDDDVEDRRHDPCCASDGGRSCGVAVGAEIANHRRLRRSRAGVVSAAGDVSL